MNCCDPGLTVAGQTLCPTGAVLWARVQWALQSGTYTEYRQAYAEYEAHLPRPNDLAVTSGGPAHRELGSSR